MTAFGREPARRLLVSSSELHSGAHRTRVHGVAGTSRDRIRTRTRKKATAGAGTSATAHTTRSRSRTSSSDGGGVNRDTLLQALFPQAIPAKQDVFAAVNSWLEEAERLSRLR